MLSKDRGHWGRVFGQAAAGTLGAGFSPERESWADWERDEFGHRRAVDRAFCAFVLGRGVEARADADPATRLWELAGCGSAGAELAGEAGAFVRPGTGSLFEPGDGLTIETWTEAELAGLHALWQIAAAAGDGGLRERCMTAARWAVEELQPDNATNRPWAAHVFVELWLAGNDAAAGLYAQTLLHNCQVMMGKPDRVSALVLFDAARMLQ